MRRFANVLSVYTVCVCVVSARYIPGEIEKWTKIETTIATPTGNHAAQNSV